MSDNYKTIAKDYRIQRTIKKCKFITSAANVKSVKEAEDFINKVSEEFADATHNVYAFKIGLGDQAIKRANDDGEPAGSSGPPVLKAIEGEEVINIVIVVTRYFGGVKHGIGGLIRAYGQSGREVIREAGIIEKERYLTIGISVSYDAMGQVINDLSGKQGKVKDTNYTNDGVEIIAAMKPSYLEAFKDRMVEATRGQARFRTIGEEFR
ncbi:MULTISPECIES: IMPACT family protein [unclassified Candidatus Frackibacter]|uniref:IMPACT family protein n=1 Tax=unclassified Candidatus Frackibacter TaxID=2648818 RepID=UPI00087F60AD|nr:MULTISPECIES: YigZ family protein [unclassified Candidatus Frackibacter]SDC64767.1 uncharacterized protein, YigZ family [Candidatus Frackibacter sp. WG11]SEM77244.1 uncharacterized protein, YigZ family [Candidatus Frackibacter sp. WG12]SFL88841.1 uncharacterized protein, YigZ family [Candidatus Frackibacter sp. WG13]